MSDVHERFAKALSAMGPIAKAQKNSHHGYSFRGIDDVMNALHAVLADHGLFYTPKCVGQQYEEWKTSKGGRLQVARLDYEFVFYAPDGSTLTIGPVIGQSADTDDKAPMQALSQAAKFALLHAFCIPTNDVEADSHSPVSAGGGRVEEFPFDKPGSITDAQLAELTELQAKLGESAGDKTAKILEWARATTLDELSSSQADAVIAKWKTAVAA